MATAVAAPTEIGATDQIVSSRADASARLVPLDWMRGLVMVLMALDHSSDAFNAGRLFTDSTTLYRRGTPLPAAQTCLADCAYDSHGFRSFLENRGTRPVVPNNRTRKHPYPFDRKAYRRRNLIERMFSRLKDFRRVATRYDKLACTYAAAICLAAIVTWWI